MRTADLFVPLVLTACSAVAFAQNVPGASPKDPVGYKSPYEMKTTPAEVCARDYRDVLLQSQSKMQRMMGVPGTCAIVEAMQDISQDYINFNRRCPDFPAARQAEAAHRANIAALQAECRPQILNISPEMPKPLVDPYARQDGMQGCGHAEDGKPLSPERQRECIRKKRQGGN